jgi:hypothetical protein
MNPTSRSNSCGQKPETLTHVVDLVLVQRSATRGG